MRSPPSIMNISSMKDALFLALTVATVVLTFFLAWFLYYLVSIIRQANGVMKEVSASIEKVREILDTIKDAIHQSTSHLGLIVTAVKQLASFYNKRRHKRDPDTDVGQKRSRSGK